MLESIIFISNTREILDRGLGYFKCKNRTSIMEAFYDWDNPSCWLHMLLSNQAADEIKTAPKQSQVVINATAVEELLPAIISNKNNLYVCVYTTIGSDWELDKCIKLLKDAGWDKLVKTCDLDENDSAILYKQSLELFKSLNGG